AEANSGCSKGGTTEQDTASSESRSDRFLALMLSSLLRVWIGIRQYQGLQLWQSWTMGQLPTGTLGGPCEIKIAPKNGRATICFASGGRGTCFGFDPQIRSAALAASRPPLRL